MAMRDKWIKLGVVLLTVAFLVSGFLTAAPQTVAQGNDIKFRGTVTKVMGDYEVRVEQILQDPTGHLSFGDLAWITPVDPSCVKGSIDVGDYVEVYARPTAKLPGQPQAWLEAQYHYIREVGSTGLPDLTFQKIGFNKPEPFKEGDVITFGATIVNQGNGEARNFQIEVYIDGQLNDSGPYSLGAGQSDTLWSENPWRATAGTHVLEWRVDTYNYIAESNENNNMASRTFTVEGTPTPRCSGVWDVWGLSGVSSSYEPGVSISGSLSYKISNNSDSPGAIGQVLVGIIDQSGRSYGVTCIYDGNPRTCPDYTSGSDSFSLTAPNSPGTYKLIAAMDRHYSCSNARGNFPNQRDKEQLATFEVGSQKYTLSTYASPSDGGSVSPSGGTYKLGTSVTLTAYPNSGWKFDRWGGDAYGSSTSTTVTMNSNKSVTAYFVKEEQYTLLTYASPSDGGSVSPSGGTYKLGTSVTLTAYPNSGWKFDRWGGDAYGSSTSTTVTMNSNKSVTAYFKEKGKSSHTLWTFIDPVNAGNISPGGGTYDEGTRIELNASPKAGWVFDQWSGDAQGRNESTTIIMDSDKRVTANFIKEETKKEHPPEIKGIVFDPPIEGGGVIAGSKLKIKILASDPNDDPLSYKASIHGLGFDYTARFEGDSFTWNVFDGNEKFTLYVTVSDGIDTVIEERLLEVVKIEKGLGYSSRVLDYYALPRSITAQWVRGDRTIFGAVRIDIAWWAKYLTTYHYGVKNTVANAVQAKSMVDIAMIGSAEDLADEIASTVIEELAGYVGGDVAAEVTAAGLSLANAAISPDPVTKASAITSFALHAANALFLASSPPDKLMEQGWDILKHPKGGPFEGFSIIVLNVNDVTEKYTSGSSMIITKESGYKFYYYEPSTQDWKLWKDATIKVRLTSGSLTEVKDTFEKLDRFFEE